MSAQEGVIHFSLEHTDSAPLAHPGLANLRQWHSRLHGLKLVGRDPHRYGGYAYGNMSIRSAGQAFIISGTQTGRLEHLQDSHYAMVDYCDITHNHVRSHGPIRPSSECMTHAAIYAATANAHAIVHVHSPEIWLQYKELGLASTARDIAYGTPAMAHAVRDCIQRMNNTRSGIIAMLGHQDGVIAWAETVEQAGNIVINALNRTD